MLKFRLLFILLINLLLFLSVFCEEKTKEVKDLEKEVKGNVEGELSDEELKKQRAEKLATLPYSHPPPDPTKARLLLYDYDVDATTVIHNPLEPEENGIKVSTKAKYYFEILNHDQDGCILGRYQVRECIHGDCENLPDIYFYIILGGQNILGVYYKPQNGSEEEKINWGLTMSLVYAITSPAKSGEGDEQITKTPFGYCRHFFAKPEDKLFTRKMDLCDFESNRNHSLIPSFVSLDYQQFIEYKQNKKIDADIVFVEADEQFIVQTPFDQNAAIRVHSHVSVEMMNRTRRYMKRYCPKGMMGNVCAQDIFGAKYLGKNWLEVNRKLNEFFPPQITLGKFVADENEKLQKCAKSEECPRLFKSLTEILRRSEPEAILEILKDKKNDAILDFLLDGIAAVGPISVWKSSVEHVKNSRRHVAHKFVQNIAFTTVSPTVALKELRTWKNDGNIDLYNTIGYLTNRRCLSTPSHLNSCIKKKDSFFNFLFENKDNVMTTEEQSKALWHLLFKSTAEYFSQFLCSQSNDVLQQRALTFYNKLHYSLFDRSINMKLLSIFWNTCPRSVPQSHSALALSSLVKVAPHHPTVGSFLLRGEKNNPENPNLWALFYQKVHEAIEHGDHNVRRYWNELRQLKIFRPNYLQRSLNHGSSNFVERFENVSVPATVKGHLVANNDGSLEELNFAFSYEKSLFGVQLNKDHGTLSLLGYPEVITDSETTQSVILRDFSKQIRLLSGYTLDLNLNTIATIKSHPEKSNFKINSGFTVEATASLLDSHQSYGTLESTIEIHAESHFGSDDLCPFVDFKHLVFEQNYSKEVSGKTEHKSSKKDYSNFVLNLGRNVNSQCLD